MLKNTKKFKEAFYRIQEAKKILLITHVRPDGDALASVGAFIDLIIGLDKEYVAYCQDEPAPSFLFLPHIEKISSNREKIIADFFSFDLIITLDCANADRTGLADEIKKRQVDQFFIEIDHHPENDDQIDLEIRDDKTIATAEIIYYFFKANNIKINKNTANCLLAGILGDSGNFLYPGISDKTVNIASEMLLLGAQLPQILKNTLQNKSLSAMKLWGLVLNNLQVNKKYNLAFSALTLDEISRFDNDEDTFDSISGFLSNLYGVKAVIFLREENNSLTGVRQVKGSLRTSHPTLDISKLANKLGGGGHAKASGFVLAGSIEKKGNSWRIM